jgi:cobalt/nickel transport system permease protein
MSKKWLGVIAVGLALAVGVALLSPLASSQPDGLEKVAQDKQFLDQARDPSYEIIPDYTLPGIENEAVATIVSGLIGVAIMAALGFGLAFVLKAASRNRSDKSASSTTSGSG